MSLGWEGSQPNISPNFIMVSEPELGLPSATVAVCARDRLVMRGGGGAAGGGEGRGAASASWGDGLRGSFVVRQHRFMRRSRKEKGTTPACVKEGLGRCGCASWRRRRKEDLARA